MYEENKALTTEGTNPAVEPGTGTSKEALTAFQRFMKSLVGGEMVEYAKEAPSGGDGENKAKETDPATKTYTEKDFATALAAEKEKWLDEQKEM